MRVFVPTGTVEEPKIGRKIPRVKKRADDDALAKIKLARKNLARNGGQGGADLAEVKN